MWKKYVPFKPHVHSLLTLTIFSLLYRSRRTILRNYRLDKSSQPSFWSLLLLLLWLALLVFLSVKSKSLNKIIPCWSVWQRRDSLSLRKSLSMRLGGNSSLRTSLMSVQTLQPSLVPIPGIGSFQSTMSPSSALIWRIGLWILGISLLSLSLMDEILHSLFTIILVKIVWDDWHMARNILQITELKSGGF